MDAYRTENNTYAEKTFLGRPAVHFQMNISAFLLSHKHLHRCYEDISFSKDPNGRRMWRDIQGQWGKGIQNIVCGCVPFLDSLLVVFNLQPCLMTLLLPACKFLLSIRTLGKFTSGENLAFQLESCTSISSLHKALIPCRCLNFIHIDKNHSLSANCIRLYGFFFSSNLQF